MPKEAEVDASAPTTQERSALYFSLFFAFLSSPCSTPLRLQWWEGEPEPEEGGACPLTSGRVAAAMKGEARPGLLALMLTKMNRSMDGGENVGIEKLAESDL